MPLYRFHIENGPSEDHEMELPNDDIAVAEGLRTAAGLVGDLAVPRTGSEVHWVEVSQASGASVLRIEIRAVRGK